MPLSRFLPVMQLGAIVESFLIASQEPLSSDEIARLVRARFAEAEDVLVRENEAGAPPAQLPEWLAGLEKTTPEEVSDEVKKINAFYAETERSFTILERPNGWKIFTRSEFGEFVKHLFPGRKPEQIGRASCRERVLMPV